MKAESRGTYVPENNLIAGIKEFEDNFYITLPRMKTGVPATLVKIPAGVSADTSPALEPFPSWEMNALGDCNALQNVQNIEIDAKGLIWIIDSGITETLNSAHTIRCPPKLLIYDLKKGATTTAYTFPDSVASHQTNFLYDIVVDDADGGYAYITDNSARDPGKVSIKKGSFLFYNYLSFFFCRLICLKCSKIYENSRILLKYSLHFFNVYGGR